MRATSKAGGSVRAWRSGLVTVGVFMAGQAGWGCSCGNARGGASSSGTSGTTATRATATSGTTSIGTSGTAGSGGGSSGAPGILGPGLIADLGAGPVTFNAPNSVLYESGALVISGAANSAGQPALGLDLSGVTQPGTFSCGGGATTLSYTSDDGGSFIAIGVIAGSSCSVNVLELGGDAGAAFLGTFVANLVNLGPSGGPTGAVATIQAGSFNFPNTPLGSASSSSGSGGSSSPSTSSGTSTGSSGSSSGGSRVVPTPAPFAPDARCLVTVPPTSGPPPECQPPPAGACRVAADCPSGLCLQLYSGSVCTVACTSASDCSPGATCRTHHGLSGLEGYCVPGHRGGTP